MADLSALYPQPPQQTNLLADPARLVGLMSQAQELQSRQAVGNAFQNALTPEGGIDPSALSKGLKAPEAAWGAPQAAMTLQEARQRQTELARSQFELGASQDAAVRNRLGQYIGRTMSNDDVHTLQAELARMGVPAATVSAWGKSLLAQSPAERKQHITDVAIGQAGPGAALTPVQGGPGAGGEPTNILAAERARIGGGLPTGMTPGAAEALAANQAEYAADQSRTAQIMASVRPLENALPLVQQLSNANFGPGSKGFADVKAALATAGIIDPNASDVTVRQEVGKYLRAYAGGARAAGRSDEALHTAMASNPNLDLTQPANLSLLKNQIAMDRMDAALPLAHGGENPAVYKSFKSNYYQNLDPKAFQFDLMTPAERAQVIKKLGDPKPDKNGTPTNPAYLKFARSYDLAVKTGMITPGAQGGR